VGWQPTSGWSDEGTVESYPVGAYYLSSTGINPATELGYGTWTQVAQGLFLVGAP
jgi:hypothetical protein